MFHLQLEASLIDKDDFEKLKQIVQSNTRSIDRLHTSPQTSSYSNPSDIVWMTWIEEEENTETYDYDENDNPKHIYHSLVEITQRIISEEKSIMLPSKKVRELIGTYELVGNELKDTNEITRTFNHQVLNGSFKDSQELVLVDEELLKESIKKEGLEIVWFVQVFKQRNPLNKMVGKDFHVQKARKYFVWEENGEKKSLKFWDERFFN